MKSRLIVLLGVKLMVSGRVKTLDESEYQLLTPSNVSVSALVATTTTMTSMFDEFEYTNRIALNYIWPTFPIGFLILGTIANILSIVIFRRKEMRKYSSFCYFAFLNFVNLAVLYVTLIRVIMEFNFHVDIRGLNMFTCKMHVFLTYFLTYLSSLLLSSISIDRVISVMFLHKAKLYCTPRVAFMVTVGLVVFNFVLASHFLLFDSGYYVDGAGSSFNETTNVSTVIELASRVVCEPRSETKYAYFVDEIWKIVDIGVYTFIPFTIMITCSIIIIIRVAQQSKKFSKKSESSGANLNRKLTTQDDENILKLNANRAAGEKKLSKASRGANDESVESTSACKLNPNQVVATSGGKSSNEAKFSTRTRNLALMLIPVNLLFLAFLAPVVITMYTYPKIGKDRLTLAIVELLSYCNFTINFFIYFITSSKFREEFFKFLNETVCRCKGNEAGAPLANSKNKNSNNNLLKTTTNQTTIRSSINQPKKPSIQLNNNNNA